MWFGRNALQARRRSAPRLRILGLGMLPMLLAGLVAGSSAARAQPASDDAARAAELNTIGLAQWRMGAAGAAIITLSRAIELAPEHPAAYNHRSLARATMGDYEGALEDAETTIALIQELNPSDDEWAVVLDTRAYALLLLGEYEDALADYDQALSATVNTHATYTLGRGLALLALGDQPRALDAFKWGSLITLGSRLDPELEDLLARMHAALAEIMPTEQPDAFEPDDTPEQATPLTPGGTAQVRSLHTAGDRDWASIDLVAGQRVHIEARSPTCDTYLSLYRADGRTVVREDDDGGVYRDSVIDARAPATETYRIQVRHFFPEGTCASYELAATVAGR